MRLVLQTYLSPRKRPYLSTKQCFLIGKHLLSTSSPVIFSNFVRCPRLVRRQSKNTELFPRRKRAASLPSSRSYFWTDNERRLSSISLRLSWYLKRTASVFCHYRHQAPVTLMPISTVVPGADANGLACTLGVSPGYRQDDLRRWISAASFYEELSADQTDISSFSMSPRSLRQRSRSQSQVYRSAERRTLDQRRRSEFDANTFAMLKSEPLPCMRCGVASSPPIGSLSLHKVSTMNRSCASTNPGSRGESSLELEAIAAVHELSFAVEVISVSEMLPRTPDLIFVNVTTVEEQPYCLELTLKGWRITSVRHDCMIGDFTRLDLFTKYYDSLYDLMNSISPGYKALFEEKVAARLREFEMSRESSVDEQPHSSFEDEPGHPIFT